MTEVDIIGAALTDAGLTATDVGMVFFSNAVAGIITGQEMIRGQVALRDTGLLGKPIVNVENACASASTAFHLAVAAVASGAVDVALAVGAEKLTHEDKARSFAAIGTAVDLSQLDELRRWTAGAAAGSERGAGAAGSPATVLRNTEGDAAEGNRSFFMDVYAANTRAYMNRTGATVEDFAQVAVKSHPHAGNRGGSPREPHCVPSADPADVLADRGRRGGRGRLLGGAGQEAVGPAGARAWLRAGLRHRPRERGTRCSGAGSRAGLRAGGNRATGPRRPRGTRRGRARGAHYLRGTWPMPARGRARAAQVRRDPTGRVTGGQPQRRPAVKRATDRSHRLRPARRTGRSATRPVRQAPGGGRTGGAGGEWRWLPGQRRRRDGGVGLVEVGATERIPDGVQAGGRKPADDQVLRPEHSRRPGKDPDHAGGGEPLVARRQCRFHQGHRVLQGRDDRRGARAAQDADDDRPAGPRAGSDLLLRRHDLCRRRPGTAQGADRPRRAAGDPRLVARLRR